MKGLTSSTRGRLLLFAAILTPFGLIFVPQPKFEQPEVEELLPGDLADLKRERIEQINAEIRAHYKRGRWSQLSIKGSKPNQKVLFLNYSIFVTCRDMDKSGQQRLDELLVSNSGRQRYKSEEHLQFDTYDAQKNIDLTISIINDVYRISPRQKLIFTHSE